MLTKLVDLFFLRACGFCGQKINKRYTCGKCLNILEYYHEKVIFHPNDRWFYDKLICGFEYKSYMKKLMLQYKFENKRYLAKSFGDLLFYKLQKYKISADIIVPVPIHKKRARTRGYNQSLYIAKVVSELMGIPCSFDILTKDINNQKQSLLDLKSRIKNVQGVYTLRSNSKIKDKTVLLIDDIYTTGMTVNECSKILKRGGAREIIVATILYGR